MIKKSKPQADDDNYELELSEELADLEDTISLEQVNEQEARESNAETEGALFTEEELQQRFEQAPVDHAEIPTLEIPTEADPEALYANDEALEAAVDNMAPPETEQAPAPKIAIKTADNSATKTEPTTNKTTQVKIDLSPFLSSQTTASAAPVDSDAASLSIADSGLNNSPLHPQTPCDNILDKQDFLEALNAAMEAEATETTASKEDAKPTMADKAKALLNKNKAHFNEYFGRSLPERELELDFIFPPQKAKKDLEPIVSLRDINKLFAIKGTSLNVIFKKAEEDLSKLAKCKLSKSQQLSLLDGYSQELFEKFASVIALYEKRPSTSDSKQVEMAENALSTIKHLITGYKKIYADIYQSANALYGPQRETASTVVFRLLELIVVEQQLAGTLHTPMPHASIKTFNTLFHALARYEPQSIIEEQHSIALNTPMSIYTMYLRFQCSLLLDLMQVPSSLHKLLNNYIQANVSLIQLLPLNCVPVSAEPAWMISHDSSDAPRILSDILRSQISNSQFVPIIIRFQKFLNQIKKDYEESLKLLKNNSSPHSSTVFKDSKTPQTLELLSCLNKLAAMIEAQTVNQNYSLYQAIKLRAYSGLAESNSYFEHLYVAQNYQGKNKNEYENDNKKELPEKPTSSKSQWQCAMQDEDTLYLQTIEAAVKIELDVGVLLLLIISNEEQEEIIPARITRLEREAQGKIKLVVEKLGDQSISVFIDDNSSALLSLQGEHKYLLVNTERQFSSNQPIDCCLPDNSKVTVIVAAIKSVSKNFQVLELL